MSCQSAPIGATTSVIAERAKLAAYERSLSRRKLRTAAIATVAAVAGGLGSYAVLDGHASAVPAPQATCRFGFMSVTADQGWRPLGLGVTIDNGTVPRQVIAQLGADIGVETGAEVRVGYSIDGGAVREKTYGPGNLANHTEFWQTRHTIAVIPLGAESTRSARTGGSAAQPARRDPSMAGASPSRAVPGSQLEPIDNTCSPEEASPQGLASSRRHRRRQVFSWVDDT